MGLDMYAYRAKAKPETQTDFTTTNFGEVELAYWRKHPNLHGWMENLYYSKGGAAESFNCVNVELTKDNLNELYKDLQTDALPDTDGFFFGKSSPDEIQNDLKFVKDALNAIDEGDCVFYTSWW